MNKINVCFFSGDITRSGGTERVATLIANELDQEEEYNISFVSLTEKRKEPFFSLNEGIQRKVLYEREVRGITHILGYIRRLRKVVLDNNIDVLIDIDGIIDIYAIPVKWFTGVKIISWEHFNLYYHPNQEMRQRVRKFAVKYVDAIVTLTEQDKKYYQSELQFKCPIEAICNPVVNNQENNIYDKESKIIISVGRLTHQKGFDRLIEVANIVLEKHSDWRWMIYGEGEDRDVLQDSINEKNISDRISLEGNVSNIEEKYKESAIFVMTSRYEGLPMTLLEAKYYKLPIVSFDIKTGPRECILDGINGYLVEDGNINRMADKICELIVHVGKRTEFSKRALEDTDKFNMDKIIKKWKRLINNI